MIARGRCDRLVRVVTRRLEPVEAREAGLLGAQRDRRRARRSSASRPVAVAARSRSPGPAATVLLVLDGLGWDGVRAPTRSACPSCAAFAGGPITTVVPSTTAAALTSITTGLAPSRHGDHRLPDPPRARRAQRPPLAARRRARAARPAHVQRTRRSRAGRSRSSPSRVPHHRVHRGAPARRRLPRLADHLGAGRARARGSSPTARRSSTRTTRASTRSRTRSASTTPYYPAELARRRPARRARCSTRCPTTPRCVVTADHGQVHVGPDGWLGARSRCDPMVETYAGDGRFRYLHAHAGRGGRAARGRASELHGERRLGVPARAAARRGLARPRPGVGHLPARSATSCSRPATGVGFVDPTLPYEAQLVGAHGSLTAAEMQVPLLAARTSARGRARNVGELHPCDSSTALWRGLWTAESRPRRRSGVGQVVRAPPPAHRVLDARRCGADRTTSWRRPRPTASPRSASPTTGTCTASSTSTAPRATPTSRRSSAPRPTWSPRAGTTARGATEHDIYHLTLLARVDAGLPQPHQGLVARVPRRLLPEAAGRLRAARAAPRGARRHHRLPRRRGVAGAPRRTTTRCARQHVDRFQAIFGRDSFFVELQDHGLPEQHQVNPQLIQLARDMRRAAARHQRLPLHAPRRRRGARRAAVRADRRASTTTRSASSSTPTSST